MRFEHSLKPFQRPVYLLLGQPSIRNGLIHLLCSGGQRCVSDRTRISARRCNNIGQRRSTRHLPDDLQRPQTGLIGYHLQHAAPSGTAQRRRVQPAVGEFRR